MIHLRIRCVLFGMALTFASGPATGQMLVYDPSNYAQNVLQAARALQQINNQVTSLQNQTQMLLNQARNLASLPYSSLQAIDQSMARTQQLLNQAQRLAYDVNQIDQAFGRSYPQSYPVSTSSQQFAGDAQTRWQNSLAAYQDGDKSVVLYSSKDGRAWTAGPLVYGVAEDTPVRATRSRIRRPSRPPLAARPTAASMTFLRRLA